DPTEVKITPIITVEKMIDKDNIYDEERPFTITGYQNYGKANQSESILSNVSTTQNGLPVKGFGVNGDITGGNNKGDARELQYGEAIVIDFEDKSVLGIDVAFAWRNQNESAKIEFFDKDGNAIGTATISGGANGNAGATSTITYTFKDKDGNTQTESKTIQGGSDGIDKPFELMLPNGEQFTKIVFTAPNVNDDYLINSIGYKEVIDGNSLDKGQKAEVTFIVETNHKPDPDWTNPNRTDGKPTADVKIEDSKGNVLFNGTVVLDADGKAIIPDIKADGVNDLKATVTNVQGNFELVDYSKAEAGVYVGDITTKGNEDNTITAGPDGNATAGNDIIIGDKGGASANIVSGTNYNIALIVDTSGSMQYDLAGNDNGFNSYGGQTQAQYAKSRMKLTIDALKNFVDSIKDHDGIVNVTLVDFNTNASTAKTIYGLTSANAGQLITAIESLKADGGTNYEAAFDKAIAWFNSSQITGQTENFENLTYFLTDGDPTYSNRDTSRNNNGSTTEYYDMKDALDKFETLSDQSKVNAIGIGKGVNENYLKFFDNTNTVGTGSVSFSGTHTETEVLGNFSETNAGKLGSIENWTDIGTGNHENKATLSYTGSGNGRSLLIDDNNNNSSGSAVVASDKFTITNNNTTLSFNYTQSGRNNNSDKFEWKLQSLNTNGTWTDVSGKSGSYNNSSTSQRTAEIKNIGTGEYRLVLTVTDGSTNGDYKVAIDNITVTASNVPNTITGNVGQSTIVNKAGDLEAALQGGSTTYDPADLGNDTIDGGAGNDIIFGDTINTDHLTWAGRILPAGSGTEALKEMIKVQNPGISDEDLAQKMYDYIKENHASLGGDGTKDGNDTIDGGAGRDIIYAQGGNDTIITDLNTNNGEADGDILIDGGTGFDTIKLEGNNDIDFSKLGDIIKNIEAIDLTDGNHKLTNISLEDVLKMSGDDNKIKITGDEFDTVTFKKNDGWELKTENIGKVEGDKTFDVYTNIGNPTVQVKVEQPISDGITN
ncbi:VWA domain-containing protein, partial [Aliarcobacter butzleri]